LYEKRVWRNGYPKSPGLESMPDRFLDQKIYLGRKSSLEKVIDAKYNTRNPNILSCQDVDPSIFWKGVMWASRAVAVGYRWKIGNDKSIKFWEDIWFGNSPLAVQFWDIYFVSNQQTQTVSDIWDGQQIRCTFRRTFSEEMMVQCQELLVIINTISFSEDEDQLIWQYETNGVYSSSSMYSLVNLRGVHPVFLPPVWELKIPPRIQVFLDFFLRIKS
jgi:hypothetical protein